MQKNIISDYTIYTKYANYITSKKRRETWSEIVERNKNMFVEKFPQLKKEIDKCFDEFVLPKKILPAMRSLQFAGDAIKKNNARMYNCSYAEISDHIIFAEALFLLLSGVGFGYSVEKQNIERLPLINKTEVTQKFVIEDDIEGWADSIKVLMGWAFGLNDKPEFIYNKIRKKGVRLVTSGGKAPGPEPLKKAHKKIFDIIESKINGSRLTSFEGHYIVCILADAVLAGGIRRAACIVFFDLDDMEMLNCKKGYEWRKIYPELERANNSAVAYLDTITKEQFEIYFENLKNNRTGEPGIFFTRSKTQRGNPCQPAWATVLTPEGIKTISDVNIGSKIWSKEGWVNLVEKWSTGVKPVYQAIFANGNIFVGTENHKLVTDYTTETLDGLDKHTPVKTPLETIAKNNWKVDCFDDKVDTILSKDKEENLISNRYTQFMPLLSYQHISNEEVFDITVDNKSHTYWTGGVNVSNCVEIGLYDKTFCNLVETNASDIESQEDFEERVSEASFLNTLQSTFTDFIYLRPEWKINSEKERLIGTSLTGIAAKKLENVDLKKGAEIVKAVNEKISKFLGIEPAHRTTTIKPAGTSTLVLSKTIPVASGVHGFHAIDCYLRNYRHNNNESIVGFFKEHFPELIADEKGKEGISSVISIPQRTPKNSITREEPSLELLERVKKFNTEWVRPGHRQGENFNNVSCTISVRDNEWEIVKEWMWNNREFYHGISILPFDGGIYEQAPFEECSEETYERLSKILNNKFDLSLIVEEDDETDLVGEAACAGGFCEL